MMGSKSFLSIDFGAGSLKVAEFDVSEAGSLRLLRYGVKALGLAGSQDASREGVVQRGLQELMTKEGFASKICNVCAPGFHVFSKFVKLPPVDSSKVTQIIQYEAQQNVPFPLEEVVWDYQILGSTASGELEVLLVALKSSIVEGLFKAAEGIGQRLDLVDASPAALCNAFRYNYGDVEGCSMLLDIGAKTSNVLFFEKEKVFSRGINIGANSITQDFSREVKMPFAKAEEFKISDGFVSLGGAYEEPDNPNQAAISKIARQVMTRLHIQVNQTIQFYRSQQGGSAPQRLYLAGGASIMPYTAQFFAEKINVPVEYFNPFRNIEIDPSVDIEDLAKVAHAFGEVVGVGLRTPARCPVELNLMPKSILKRQELNQKKPYFMAAVLSLAAVVLIMAWFYNRLSNVKQSAIAERQPTVDELQSKVTRLTRAIGARDNTRKVADQLTEWMTYRFVWADLVSEVQQALQRTEMSTRRPGMRSSVWIERMVADTGEAEDEVEEEEEEDGMGAGMDIRMMLRYGLVPPGFKGAPGAEGGIDGLGSIDELDYMDPSAAAAAEPEATNEISVVKLRCRAVSWNKLVATADAQLAIRLLEELKGSPFFVGGTNGTQLTGSMQPDEASGTYTFSVQLKLANPIKL